MKIVGKGTQGMKNVFRVPACFEFQAFPLNYFAGKEIFDVDGKVHGVVSLRYAWVILGPPSVCSASLGMNEGVMVVSSMLESFS